MNKYLKMYTIFYCLIIITLFSCNNGRKIPKSGNVSISKEIEGVYTKQHFRKGWMFVDQFNGKQLIYRKVYLNDSLMYRYPIKQSELFRSNIKLHSGNDYLVSKVPDTLNFENKDLPVMNRNLYAIGGTISRISDRLYLIKSSDTSKRVVFYVSVSANMDEINNSEQFISDSLVLQVR